MGIFLSYDGVVCPRLASFHYVLTPSDSFLLGHRTCPGVVDPQRDIKLSCFIQKVVKVDFEQGTPAAITLDENGFCLRHLTCHSD